MKTDFTVLANVRQLQSHVGGHIVKALGRDNYNIVADEGYLHRVVMADGEWYLDGDVYRQIS